MPNQGKFEEAMSLLKRAMEINITLYGQDNQKVAFDLDNQAALLREQVRYSIRNQSKPGKTRGLLLCLR